MVHLSCYIEVEFHQWIPTAFVIPKINFSIMMITLATVKILRASK